MTFIKDKMREVRPPCGILVPAIHMCASMRVEGKLFEVSGEKGVVFPFRVADVSKRRVFVIKL